MARTLLESHQHPKHARLRLDLRTDSKYYQARIYLDGKQRGKSTETSSLKTAFKIGEEWYVRELRASTAQAKRHPIDRLTADPTIAQTYQSYRAELTGKRRDEAAKRWGPIQTFWRALRLSDVRPQTFKDFYRWRRRRMKAITAHTLHKDVVLVRQILKHALEQEQIEHLPLIPRPGKIETNPRPWLNESEWQHLRAVSQQRIETAPNARTKQQRLDCDHFMRFMVASCARVDELRGLRFLDCRYRFSPDGLADRLICRVSGKRGTRDLVADQDAVDIVGLREGKADDLVFPHHSRDTFRELLIAAGLRTDTFGNERNYKSLRSTAISRLVLAGEDVTFIARNAGTSIAMIDTYYVKRLTADLKVQVSHPVEVPVSDGR